MKKLFSLSHLASSNPRLADWMLWRFDDWQGAGAFGDNIHFGCGNHILDGFVNLDFLPVSPCVSACNLLAIWPERLSGTISIFYSEDVIERFFLSEQLYILASMNYLMKADGLARLLTPDMSQLWGYSARDSLEPLVGTGDFFADVMRCRNGLDAVNMGLRMGGHRWLHDAMSLKRIAVECGFEAERTPCAVSSDSRLCGVNIRDESGIAIAMEFRKKSSLKRLLIEPEEVRNADLLEDLGEGQKLYRARTSDPYVSYRFADVSAADLALACVRGANSSEFLEHNFAKAYFRPEEAGAIYIDRTLQSAIHANIFTNTDITVALAGEKTLGQLRFDPSEREGDYFTTGPLELFIFEDDGKEKSHTFFTGAKNHSRSLPESLVQDLPAVLPSNLAGHVIKAPCRYGQLAHFDFDGPIGRALDLYGEWAQLELESILLYAPFGGTVVDVGANVGAFSLGLAQAVGACGQVHVLEPQIEVFALLENNVRANQLEQVVSAYNVAAGQSKKMGKIPRIDTLTPQNLGAVALVDGDSLCQDSPVLVDVEIIGLDDMDLSYVDLLKIDTEGSEMDILLGASKLIAKSRPVIALECSQFADVWPCLSLLLGQKYDAFHLRHCAFNPDNIRNLAHNIFGDAEEGMLLLLPHERIVSRELADPPPHAIPVRTSLDIIYAILSTKLYGAVDERNNEKLWGSLMNVRRKRAEERCVIANTLSVRRNRSIVSLREVVADAAKGSATVESLVGVLKGTAPIPPPAWESLEPAPWPKAPMNKEWENISQSRKANAQGYSPVVDVIVPCYDDLDATLACLFSVLTANIACPFEVVVISDACPDPHLTVMLRRLKELGLITLLENGRNCGFVASANKGMALHSNRHALLLNADTIVFNGWIDRLLAHLDTWPNCGTVTPLSNNATICSYPVTERNNVAALEVSFSTLDALTAKVNAGRAVEIPTGVGSCMLIHRDCLALVGNLDETEFGTGYGEENDFCMRALEKGWTHILATDVFIRHAGERSFLESAALRKVAAYHKVMSMHPSYQGLVSRYCTSDPARPMRRALDIARLRRVVGEGKAFVLLVGHTRGGGTERHLLEQAQNFKNNDMGVFTLRPRDKESVCVVQLNAVEPLHVPNLAFDISTEFGELLAVLAELNISSIKVHSMADLHPDTPFLIFMTGQMLHIPIDFTVHDYLAVCPEVNMLNENHQPCTGSEIWRCQVCQDKVAHISGHVDMARWRHSYTMLLEGARSVIVPSQDAATRILGHFPGCKEKLRVVPHAEIVLPAYPVISHLRQPGEVLRVAVIGAIGPHKGSALLEACARDAHVRELPMTFTVIGYTDRDPDLQALGVTITGRYTGEEVYGLIEKAACHMAWFPSPWPETYCYTLSEAGLSGLFPVVFDHGAPAERISQWGFGARLPLENLNDAEAVNNILLSLTPVKPPLDLAEQIINPKR